MKTICSLWLVVALVWCGPLAGQDATTLKRDQVQEALERGSELRGETHTHDVPVPQQDVRTELAANPFRRAVLSAIPAAVQEGKLTRVEAIRLRVAMTSPAFVAHAKDLALIRMASSGSENVPRNELGAIDETAINWEGLLEFMKAFLPLLLELLKGLGIGG